MDCLVLLANSDKQKVLLAKPGARTIHTEILNFDQYFFVYSSYFANQLKANFDKLYMYFQLSLLQNWQHS